MKKVLIVLTIMMSVVSLGDIYVEIEKKTNGSYELSLPKVDSHLKFKNGVIYEPEVALKFTSKRDEGVFSPNHYSVWTNHNFGYSIFVLRDGIKDNQLISIEQENINDVEIFITNSVGVEFIFEENDLGAEEGFNWFNILRVGIR